MSKCIGVEKQGNDKNRGWLEYKLYVGRYDYTWK